MNTKAIFGELKQDRNRLDRAIAALEALGDAAAPRKPGGAKESPISFNFGANKPNRGRRKMSATGRRKISEMMKKWWAQRRKGKA